MRNGPRSDHCGGGTAGRRALRIRALLWIAAGLALTGAAPVSAAIPGDTKDRPAPPVRATEPGAIRTDAVEPSPGTIATRVTPAGPQIVVSLARPAAAAAFAYGGHAWIVIATRETLTRKPAPRAVSGLLAGLEITRLDAAVALRLPDPEARRVTAEPDGATWRFTVHTGAAAPDAAGLRPALRRATLETTVVAVPRGRLSAVHRLVDPVVGTTLIVVTTADPGDAVAARYRVPAFSLLPTWLGLAVEVRADGVEIGRDAEEFLIRYRRPETAPARR